MYGLYNDIKCVMQEMLVHGGLFFLLYINDDPDDVICNVAIYADDISLHCKFDRASDLMDK